MKIALIGPVYPYRGGIAHYTTALASAFGKAGHDVRVYSFSRQYPKWLYPGKSDKDPSQPIQRIEAIFSIDTLNPITWFKTANLIGQYQPDLVILQWWTTFMAPAFRTLTNQLKRSGTPLLYIIHNVFPHELKPWDSYLVKSTLSLSDAFLVHSKREKDKITLSLPEKKIYYHELPIFEIDGNKIINKRVAKQYLKLDPVIPTLLFFGIVRPYKGLRDLLHSLAILKNDGYSFVLLIAGEFWEKVDYYRELVNELNLQNNVIFHNRYIPNEEVSYFFSAADLFVAPYREGTQSASIRLAIGYGIPIVISNAIEDNIITNMGKAIIFEKGNIHSLVNALRLVVNDLPLDNKNANYMVVDNLWNSLINEIQQIFRDLR